MHQGMLTSCHTVWHAALYRYLFSTTGINACNYDMDEAGVYIITFTVTNSQGLSASVNRTLVVEPVCPAGETLCSNKVKCFLYCLYLSCLSSAVPMFWHDS